MHLPEAERKEVPKILFNNRLLPEDYGPITLNTERSSLLFIKFSNCFKESALHIKLSPSISY